MIRKFAAYIGGYKRQTLLTPLMMAGEVGLEVAIPALMAQIVNIGVATGDFAYIARTGVLMIGMAALSLCFGAVAARLSSTAAAGFAKNLREALFNRVLGFSFSNIDKFETASLVTRLTTDVMNAQQTFMMMIRIAVRAPLMLLCALIMAILVNARLAMVFLFAAPLLAGAIVLIVIFAYPRFLEMLKSIDKMNGRVQENLTGIRVVKAFVREDYEIEKFNEVSGRVRAMAQRAQMLAVWVMPLMQAVMFATIVAILWFGGGMITVGGMLTGDLMSFITYTSQILMSLMMLGMMLVMFVMTKASLTRIQEVLDEQPDIVAPERPETEVRDGGVRLENVTFRYKEGSGENTLKSVDIDIAPGETVGVVGATGAAKTTLVQLIPRLYDAQEGAVYVGGKNVKEYDLKALRDAVAMVLQNNVLFSGTIRENLCWGNEHATNDEIAAACRVAQAHSFIMGFSDGYETQLGQGGVNLSGGQKQRLCIARALLKRPKIMILDDSMSAVDTATDRALRAGLRTELSHMTTIIIAQRVASVMDADKIMVMDAGRVAAVGTHEELLRDNEIYREVYLSQRKGVEENA